MIKRIEKPEVLDYIKFGEFFELHDDNGRYAYFALEFNPVPNTANIHMEVSRFSHNVLKTMREDFMPGLRELCRERNIKKVIARKQGTDSRFPKLVKFLGFSEPINIKMSYLDV